jgi:hypothetical protein
MLATASIFFSTQICRYREPLKTPPGFLARTKNEKRRFRFSSKSKPYCFDFGWHIHVPRVSSKNQGFFEVSCSLRALIIFSLQSGRQPRPMFGDATRDAFTPHPKTAGLQLATHDANNVRLGKAGFFADLIEGGSIFPRHANDRGGKTLGHSRWHRNSLPRFA